MKRIMLLLATTTCLVSQVAHAQSENNSEATQAESGEIVVTAQKRSERLTDVPISISAISGDALEASGARSLTDLTTVASGLYFASNGAFAQPVIRGVSASVTGAGADANVAIYIDGVYQPNQTGNFGDLLDIEQIEVLKGPQGTLFGRNATGGAINIKTSKPSFTPSGKMSFSYGRFNDLRLTANASAGLSDTLAIGFSALYGDDDGYTQNLGTGNKVSDANSQSFRGKLLWEPSDSTSLLLTGDWSKRSDNSAFALQPLNDNNNNRTRPGRIPVTNKREVSLTFDPQIDTETTGISLRGDFDLGFASLSSISSWRTRENYILTDSDRTNLALIRADINQDQETWTQEFNLVSPSTGAFRWFAGFFYYEDDDLYETIVNLTNPTLNNVKTTAYAPFGEVNFDLTSDLTLIGGLRYNVEKKEYVGVRGTVRISADQTFKNTTPRIGVRYALNDNSNAYATWSRGFKSGNFDSGSFNTNVILPEEIDAYELGYKYGRGATSLSIAGYYYNYKNIQFQALNPIGAGNLVFNAARAEIYGADIDFSVRPAEGLTLRGGLAYTHARYKDFPRALIYQPVTTAVGGNILIPLGGTNPVTGEVNSDGAAGKKLSRMPDIGANLSVNYEHKLASGSSIQFNTNAYYSGAFFWTPQNRLKQGAHAIVNGEISWNSPDKRLQFALWGRNLTNETYGLYVVDALGGDSAGYARPRTFGIRAQLGF
jgi:iron complex outermembrane receptor protein